MTLCKKLNSKRRKQARELICKVQNSRMLLILSFFARLLAVSEKDNFWTLPIDSLRDAITIKECIYTCEKLFVQQVDNIMWNLMKKVA